MGREWLKNIRIEKQVSQTKISGSIGISQQSYCNNIYETPGKPTEVEIILTDVNVRIENQADSTDERAS